MTKPWSKETPLRAPRYAQLVIDFLGAEDVHERYLLSSLVAWHVPVPWRHWTQFWMNYTGTPGSGVQEPERENRDQEGIEASIAGDTPWDRKHGGGFCMECGMFCTTPEHDAHQPSVPSPGSTS